MNMLLFYCLLFIFLLPIFFVFYLSHFQWALFFSSLFFIISFSLATHIICARAKIQFRIVLNLFFSYLLIFTELMRLASYYIQGESFNDRFFFHFTLNTIQNAWLTFPLLTWGSIFALLFVAILSIRLSLQNSFKTQSISFALFLLLVSFFTSSAIKELINYQWQNKQTKSSQEIWTDKEFSALGINTKVLNQPKPEAQAGRNLILIYMESLESIYTHEHYFKALTPNINRFKKQGAYFSDIRPFTNTGWTIAGIVASQCGSPLVAQTGITGNNLLLDGFLSKAVCLGDILGAAGYQQVFMGGAPHQFAGKGQFFLNHHYNEIYGTSELRPFLDDPTYTNAWGLYDDSLFDLSYKKFEQLAHTQKPFNLTLLTVDIHAPAGHTSKSCHAYPYINNKVLDAVYCTDQLIGHFVDKISKHPAYKNTSIVLISDHLSMRNAAEKYYPEKSKRKLEFIVLNSAIKGEINNTGTIMDMSPTLLELLEIKHNAEFLVRGNLLKKRESILDKQSVKAIQYINSQILSPSNIKLCPKDTLSIRSIGNHLLLIGDKRLPLYFEGHPISLHDFRDKYSIILFFDDDFMIQNYYLAKQENISVLIKKHISSNYLLIEKILPSGIGIWLGRSWKVKNIGIFESVNNINLILSECSKNRVESPIGVGVDSFFSLDAHLLEKCDTQKEYAIYKKKEKTLELYSIEINKQFYNALLDVNETGDKLIVRDYEKVDNNQCIASSSLFFEHKLMIFNLRLNGKIHHFTLNQEASLTDEWIFLIPQSMQAQLK